MANDSKFEDIKKEIRSLLISYQDGTSLSDFRKEYRCMIGRNLPFSDFAFKDEYSFLKAMPDVVQIYPSPVRGDYHLMAVADDSTKHIQKMVCKQKTSKYKTKYRAPREVCRAATYNSVSHYNSFSRPYGKVHSYALPPRLSKKAIPKGVDEYVSHLLKNYPSGVKLNQFLSLFCKHYNREFKFREWGFCTLEECLETIPNINAKNKNNEIVLHLVKNDSEVNYAATPEVHSKEVTNHSSKNYPVVESKLNPCAPDFFDRNFNKKESNSCIEKKASSTSESNSCVEKKPNSTSDNVKVETPAVSKSTASSNNFLIDRMIEDSLHQNAAVEYEKCVIEEPFHSTNQSQSYMKTIHSDNNTVDQLDDFPLTNFKTEPATNNLLCGNSSDEDSRYLFAFDSPLVKDPVDSPLIRELEEPSLSGVSKIVRNNLIKVIDNYPQGIFATQFPSCYEKVTGTSFDLHSLGFNDLNDLIDSVPDILLRKPLTGSRKDCIIFSVKSALNDANSEPGLADGSALFIECVILNTRRILQANPEGIPISSFNHHYSINCVEPLYIRDLGFDNLEIFLLYIASRVPLKVIEVEGEKLVQLTAFESTIKPPMSPALKPFDIAPLDAKFTPYKLPPDFNFELFHPVYTASIAHPWLLYLQFKGEETSERLINLYEDINEFYKGEMSDLYRMKPVDIKLGVSCIALWPGDKDWYRATIASIVSLDFVKVYYQDYGMSDEVPMHMLRYIRNDYMTLPVQAVKSRLKYLKPLPKPGQVSPSWDKKVGERMLQLCQDQLIMAQVKEILNDSTLGVVLCDTNGETDLYINDILINEGLADVAQETEEPQQPVAPSMPAESFQQMVADIVAKVMASNATNADLTSQLHNLSLNSLLNPTQFGFAPQQSLPPLCQQYPNVSPLISSNFNPAIPTFGNGLNLNANASISAPKYPPGLNIPIKEEAPKATNSSKFAPLNPSPPLTLSPDDEEIFDDDDDEYFEQLCLGNIDLKKRYVKRVKTTDGYVFHVLLYDSQPYISSGDISVLIWHAKNPSYLFHKLQAQEIELASMTLMESGNEEFFSQIERFKVRGVEKMGSVSSILLHPLSKTNQILNLFGHPSATLRAKISTEIATFNPSSSHWQELPDSEMPEEVEDVKMVTDDDKMNRLCLYDLKTMREGIRCKRLKLVKRKESERTNTDLDEEINKLNQLFSKVRERIFEIEQIIKMFSERAN